MLVAGAAGAAERRRGILLMTEVGIVVRERGRKRRRLQRVAGVI